MTGFRERPHVGPGSELQLTLDGRAVPHHDIVAAEGGPEPSAATAEGELVDAVLTELEVGEETDARELDLPLARGRARGEKRLRHPGAAELDRHAANAHAKPTPRGWRLVKSSEGAQIDGLIALAMSAERVEQPVHATRFLGWID